MATTQNKKSKNQEVSDLEIISLFMQFEMEGNGLFNEYTFCKAANIDENHFYSHFSSMEDLKSKIWLKFLDNATQKLLEDQSFASYSSKERLLGLFFTLFEVFTLNRSYVLFASRKGIKNSADFSHLLSFRKKLIAFVKHNVQEPESGLNDKIKKVSQPVFAESVWIQFMMILKFWINDTSPSFEKTDVFIEKSVTTTFDLWNTKPFESVLDLRKFLWKEKMM